MNARLRLFVPLVLTWARRPALARPGSNPYSQDEAVAGHPASLAE